MNVIKIFGSMNREKPYLFNRVMDIQTRNRVAGKYIQPFGDVMLKPHDQRTMANILFELAKEGIVWFEDISE